jgi:hypothetical protein
LPSNSGSRSQRMHLQSGQRPAQQEEYRGAFLEGVRASVARPRIARTLGLRVRTSGSKVAMGASRLIGMHQLNAPSRSATARRSLDCTAAAGVYTGAMASPHFDAISVVRVPISRIPGDIRGYRRLAAHPDVLSTRTCSGAHATRWPPFDLQGLGIRRSSQILRARKSFTSRCLGTEDDLRARRLTYTVWLLPSRRNSHWCCSRCRIRSVRFMPPAKSGSPE